MTTLKAAGHFWDWFQKNEDIYIDFFANKSEKEVLYHYNELQAHARAYCKLLGIDFSPATKTKGTLVVTAYAKPGGFRKARLLAKRAPKLDRWEVIGLRQPNPIGSFMTQTDSVIDIELSRMWFQKNGIFSRDRQAINVYVDYILPSEEKHIWGYTMNMIENLIGEEDIGYHIYLYDVDAICNAHEDEKLYPLETLPAFINKHRRTFRVDKTGKFISR